MSTHSEFVHFAKRIGIIAGAAIAVITLSNIITGAIMARIMVPVNALVAEERVARVQADDKLTDALAEVQRQGAPQQPARVIYRPLYVVRPRHRPTWTGPPLYGRDTLRTPRVAQPRIYGR